MVIILGNKVSNPSYPVVAVRDGIVFPKTENVLVFGRSKSIATINEALKRDKKMVLIMQKNVNEEDPKKENLLTIGVLVSIEKTIIGEKGEVNAMVKGIEKIKILEFTKEVPYFEAKVEKIEEVVEMGDEINAMVKYISQQMKNAINHGKAVDFVFLMNILNVSTPVDFSYQIAAVLEPKEDERQKLLEESDLKKRLKMEVELINREVKILEIEQNISAKTQKKFERGMKETFLKEKMKTIKEELGGGDETKETKEYEMKIRKACMPEDVEKKAIKELKRLMGMSQFNPETSYVKNYLDWLVELPWKNDVGNTINVKAAEVILNEDHYGLKKIKERILEYLAVLELRRSKEALLEKGKGSPKKSFQPTIICFAGPPGVGKTSLGRSIARALGRKFVKVSLGGVRDEAEIRGHRRTYVGAMPGRIIQGIKQAGTRNPLFMLDEIDKIGRDYRGDASAALLEALDPEQNHAFSDHYLEVPYDLSDVFFITTANILDTIPDALRDRLEIIHFPGYTVEEKFHIVKQYLMKKQQEAHSVSVKEGSINDSALKLMISRYTREAGVRELERQVATVFRKRARELVEKKQVTPIVTSVKLPSYLGPYKYSNSVLETKNTIGISTGLAWTQAGGDILFIEVAIMPGKGALTLTGQLGDVMKESCQAALSYIRSRWETFGLEKDFYHKIDIHVHVPEGAVPKDGPSAGLAITTAMVSALTKNPFRRDVAMTGEVTLRGRALEIGGVKEKVIAAQTAGVKTIILPKENKKDLEDIPDNVKSKLNFIFVEQADEVFPIALEKPIKGKISP
ncbi:endopeptidase La [Candidatus Roizmanbacteria bacterium CG03_land_8_20_14_0_80_39_12]|uniref:Lon protease n=1 Tax=Candidatus Roizmanbacteria bacterium CG03_land_8_20_14_0_80_39_12 TaxID=1974847 RepID=A0A2M7BRC0_9BACT|nr:MAG: endopeptidase La [Candidatus Roizmanbacteria bacterium CG03_land_8_20_14_0_80_39_12]